MASYKEHDFFKTSLVADKYDSTAIMNAENFNLKHDNLYFSSRRNGLRDSYLAIFKALDNSFNLEFMVNDDYIDSWEEYDEKQIIFPLEKQVEVVQSINALYSAIENHQLNFESIDDKVGFVEEAKSCETSLIKECLDPDWCNIRRAILILELIKRFFEESIEEKKTIIKYELY